MPFWGIFYRFKNNFIFSHPDSTVGIGISPIHAIKLADFTAGMELHQTPKYI